MKKSDIIFTLIAVLITLSVVVLIGQVPQQDQPNPYQDLLDQNTILQQNLQSGVARIQANNLAMYFSQLLHMIPLTDESQPTLEWGNQMLVNNGYGRYVRVLPPVQGPVLQDSTETENE